MTCFACGYVGDDSPAHARRHWQHQIAIVQAFGKAHPGMTECIGINGQPRLVPWGFLTSEALTVYRELLAKAEEA